MIEYPVYADLVKILELDWYHSESFVRYSPEITCIKEARTYSVAEESASNVEEEDPKMNLVHLLYLLKQLEVLDIKTGHRYDRGIFSYLANFLNSHPSRIQRFEWRRGDLPLPALIPALLVPSLRVLSSISIMSQSFDPLWFPYLPEGTELASWYGKSNVEELCLVKGEIEGKDLEQILRLPRALKILICDGSSSSSSSGVNVELQRAFERVSKTLEFLHMLLVPSISTGGLIPSFDYLTSLKFLVLHHSVLFDGRRGNPAGGLPPYLEVLFTFAPGDEWPLDPVLESWEQLLTKKSSTCLPKLKIVGHQPKTTLLLPLIDLAKSRKVEIARRFADYLAVRESYLSEIRSRYPHDVVPD
ncbi:7708_t:CDS:1 [Acaulospora colombiana]|uniref:7708_t:CDS:1 n=1 Tax=Acaulospora colombiana TaxID=27376 RepID=A0ACA9Q1Z5_9GLOM|nr:7708_t:CDS:1 [Acaulospora colombiana]